MAKLSADGKSVTVEKGDTLSKIAEDYGKGKNYKELAKLNNISDPNHIVVGQVINLVESTSPGKTNTSSKPVITLFGLQSNTDRTVFASWSWDKDNTKNYRTVWYYATGDGIAFVGNDSTSEYKQSVYTAPENAKKVKFKVLPVSETHKVNDTETTYWTAEWSTEQIYEFDSNPPVVPPIPTVTLDQYTLTATLENLNVNAEYIQFQVVRDDNGSVYKTGKDKIMSYAVTHAWTVEAGSRYKVRCRSVRGDIKSAWSEYSANFDTAPKTPKINKCYAKNETSVSLKWTESKTAKTYDIEYATDSSFFDGSNQTQTQTGIESTQYIIGGLESGHRYYFRVRAVNDEGHSGWSELSDVVIATKPVAPTTWSSTTTADVGETVNLYWIHNSADGSKQTYAKVELTINGTTTTHLVDTSADAADDTKEETTHLYSIDTSKYTEGTTITWRVQTAGVAIDNYSDWSMKRTINVYAPASISLVVLDYRNDWLDVLTRFPFYITAHGGPSSTQTPVGYHVTITAAGDYEGVDNVGNVKNISKGDVIYSKFYDISGDLRVIMSPSDVDLRNNVSYVVNCTVTMNSGRTASDYHTFRVSWPEVEYEPNAEVAFDKERAVAYIRPYCENNNGAIISDVYLGVYRREFDGSFTEIVKSVKNSKSTYVTDPHPSLDYARYRIVATSKTTGSVSYYDLPAYPVREPAAIIQWDDTWTTFDTNEDAALEASPWEGSMVRLPYNIDVTEKTKTDVSLVKYIGRKHPVSYYGTQRDEGATWKMVIDKKDKETLYSLRRLAVWPGDVYVREPSGIGYWANVTVSLDQKHLDVTIPVTIDITRVEGGM